MVVRVVAPLPHSAPDRIEPCSVIVTVPMNGICLAAFRSHFTPETPAGLCVATPQVVRWCDYCQSAIAYAFPPRLVVAYPAKFNNSQSTEFLANQIYHMHPPLDVFSRLGFQFFSGVLHRQAFTDEEVFICLYTIVQVYS